MPKLKEILNTVELREVEVLLNELECAHSKREVRKIDKKIKSIYEQAKTRHLRDAYPGGFFNFKKAFASSNVVNLSKNQ